MADQADLRGMATTASAVLAGRRSACLAHVGDSRIYAMRNGSLKQLTHDHSWVEEQVRAGTMTEAAARQHPWRNVVTRALSGGSDPDIDTVEITPYAGERFLLCSDGLSGVVSREDIEGVLGDRTLSLDEICDRLVAAANEGGGPDNVTALVIEIAPGDAA
jgi:protein phosphatase